MEITVASWNIWVFGDRDVEGIAKVIRENDIDVIGIQEAAIYYDEDSPLNIIEDVAEELGYNYVFYPALDFRKYDSDRQHEMGNAVISRYPIKDSEPHSLNPENISYDGTPEKEPRILINTEIDVEGASIRFLTTHLQYSHRFNTTEIRTAEVQNLLSVVDSFEEPVVLAGDFNAPLENEELQMVEEKLERVGSDKPTWTVKPFDYRGWSVDELEYRLDNLFISGDLEYRSSKTISSQVSDHLPVKATISRDR